MEKKRIQEQDGIRVERGKKSSDGVKREKEEKILRKEREGRFEHKAKGDVGTARGKKVTPEVGPWCSQNRKKGWGFVQRGRLFREERRQGEKISHKGRGVTRKTRGRTGTLQRKVGQGGTNSKRSEKEKDEGSESMCIYATGKREKRTICV